MTFSAIFDVGRGVRAVGCGDSLFASNTSAKRSISVSSVSMLQAGADILVMRDPTAATSVKKFIEKMMLY